MIEYPNIEKKTSSPKKDFDTAQIDTFYGIKNEGEIPVRKIELHTTAAPAVKKLFDPIPRITNAANWEIIILIISFLMLGFAKAFRNNRFKQAVKGLYNYSVALEITREEKVFFHQSNLIFTIIHLLTSSLFLYQRKEIIHSTRLEANSFISFLIILGFIVATYIIKYVFAKVLFFILNDNSIVSEYIFNISLYNNLLGVTLIPILLLSYFSSIPAFYVLFYIAIPLMLIIFLFRLIRLYLIGITKGISYFYIFLYICTLEILPLVVLLRIFIIK